MVRSVLVTFDIDISKSSRDLYRKAYELLGSYGLKTFAANILNLVDLPTTTVIGDVTMGDTATVVSLREQFVRELIGAGVPVTHIVVAFLDGYAGLGEPLKTVA